MVKTSDVFFDSDGVRCAGRLYRSADATERLPCVVMGHGFSGTMDALAPYAKRFADAGLAALTFDYRYFGESDGEPRQLTSVKRQRQDWRAAIRFARTLDGVDPERIALWGTSFSGGHVIAVAKNDPRIAAVVAQVPLIDAWRGGPGVRNFAPSVVLRFFAAAFRDAFRGLLGRPPYLLPVYGRPGEIAQFTDPRVEPFFEALQRESPTWRNAFTPRILLAAPMFQPSTAKRLAMPLLVCVAEQDAYASPSFAAKVAMHAPQGELKRYLVEHFEVYPQVNAAVFERVIADQIDFLRTHLQGTEATPQALRVPSLP